MPQFLNRILCIDDDDHLLQATKLVLEETRKYDIVQFTQVKEALHFLEKQTPDIILLDVMMPQMEGTDAFYQIRGMPHLYTVPVIFMTAKIAPEEVEHYIGLGGTAVITKPFDPLDLPYQLEFILGNLRRKS